jgi:hypothetical protein
MKPDTWSDRMRARVLGGSDPELDAAIARDPELARRAAELRAAWEATRALEGAPPASRTTYADLARRQDAERRRVFVRRAAAALVLVLGAAAAVVLATRERGADAPVVVERIPASPAEAVPPHSPVPATLADYAPVKPEGIQWIASLDDARGMAQAVGRPLLVFGYVPGCPWCKTLREVQFDDLRFRDLAERTVPVAVDLMALDPAEAERWTERGYPVVELQTERGELLQGLSGPPGEVDLVGGLSAGLDGWPTEPPALAWTAANDLARILVASLSDERQGRFSHALAGFETLAERGGPFTLGVEGRAGRARIAESARTALLEARDVARRDADAAARRLEEDARRLAGTPYAADLERVLRALREREHFPELAWAGS